MRFWKFCKLSLQAVGIVLTAASALGTQTLCLPRVLSWLRSVLSRRRIWYFFSSMEKHQHQYLAEYFLAFLPEDVLHTPSLFWAG